MTQATLNSPTAAQSRATLFTGSCGRDELYLFRFRRYRLVIAFERGNDRMPGENRTLHTRRKFVHAGKYGELADLSFNTTGCHHVVDLIEQSLHFSSGFSFDTFGQQ